jgi:hypothetical protein
MYSRSAKGGEKGDPNRNPWLAKMIGDWKVSNIPFAGSAMGLQVKVHFRTSNPQLKPATIEKYKTVIFLPIFSLRQ